VDYQQILPALFVGSHPERTEDIEALQRKAGISAVLNLQTDDDIQYLKLQWNSLLMYYSSCGIELRRVPMRDFDPVDLEAKLPSCVAVLHDLIQSSYRVYLHCSAGTGRSPSVAIAYLCWSSGLELDAAAAHVMQCRPCTPNIEAIRRAIKSAAAGKIRPRDHSKS
jgi:protein-tyrosine phosphatase